MELLLIRHGRPHPGSDPKGVDPGLTQAGRAHAQAIASVLATGRYGKVSAIVTSTMRRAVETAEPAVRLLGLDPARDERLSEFDRGAVRYHGGIDHFAARAEAWASINDGHWGDHTFDPVAYTAQILQGVEDAIESCADGNLALFCHGGMISAYISVVIGAPRPFFFAPDYGSVSRVLAGPGDYRELLSANETGHLSESVRGQAAAGGPLPASAAQAHGAG